MARDNVELIRWKIVNAKARLQQQLYREDQIILSLKNPKIYREGLEKYLEEIRSWRFHLERELIALGKDLDLAYGKEQREYNALNDDYDKQLEEYGKLVGEYNALYEQYHEQYHEQYDEHVPENDTDQEIEKQKRARLSQLYSQIDSLAATCEERFSELKALFDKLPPAQATRPPNPAPAVIPKMTSDQILWGIKRLTEGLDLRRKALNEAQLLVGDEVTKTKTISGLIEEVAYFSKEIDRLNKLLSESAAPNPDSAEKAQVIIPPIPNQQPEPVIAVKPNMPSQKLSQFLDKYIDEQDVKSRLGAMFNAYGKILKKILEKKQLLDSSIDSTPDLLTERINKIIHSLSQQEKLLKGVTRNDNGEFKLPKKVLEPLVDKLLKEQLIDKVPLLSEFLIDAEKGKNVASPARKVEPPKSQPWYSGIASFFSSIGTAIKNWWNNTPAVGSKVATTQLPIASETLVVTPLASVPAPDSASDQKEKVKKMQDLFEFYNNVDQVYRQNEDYGLPPLDPLVGFGDRLARIWAQENTKADFLNSLQKGDIKNPDGFGFSKGMDKIWVGKEVTEDLFINNTNFRLAGVSKGDSLGRDHIEHPKINGRHGIGFLQCIEAVVCAVEKKFQLGLGVGAAAAQATIPPNPIIKPEPAPYSLPQRENYLPNLVDSITRKENNGKIYYEIAGRNPEGGKRILKLYDNGKSEAYNVTNGMALRTNNPGFFHQDVLRYLPSIKTFFNLPPNLDFAIIKPEPVVKLPQVATPAQPPETAVNMVKNKIDVMMDANASIEKKEDCIFQVVNGIHEMSDQQELNIVKDYLGNQAPLDTYLIITIASIIAKIEEKLKLLQKPPIASQAADLASAPASPKLH